MESFLSAVFDGSAISYLLVALLAILAAMILGQLFSKKETTEVRAAEPPVVRGLPVKPTIDGEWARFSSAVIREQGMAIVKLDDYFMIRSDQRAGLRYVHVPQVGYFIMTAALEQHIQETFEEDQEDDY